MSPIEQYKKWRREPAIGCMFARTITIRPSAYEQVFESITSASTAARTAEKLAKRVDALIADKSTSAAALVLPDLDTLEGVARVMLGLADQPGWAVTVTPLENEVVGAMVAIRVVKEIPFGNGSCVSETLVLGPFAEFPATRRSPLTAMELFVGEPLPNDPKTGAPTVQANLAHIPAREILGDEGFDKVWKKSEEGRERSLGTKKDNRAKAKVTLTIPPSLARSLGCAL